MHDEQKYFLLIELGSIGIFKYFCRVFSKCLIINLTANNYKDE